MTTTSTNGIYPSPNPYVSLGYTANGVLMGNMTGATGYGGISGSMVPLGSGSGTNGRQFFLPGQLTSATQGPWPLRQAQLYNPIAQSMFYTTRSQCVAPHCQVAIDHTDIPGTAALELTAHLSQVYMQSEGFYQFTVTAVLRCPKGRLALFADTNTGNGYQKIQNSEFTPDATGIITTRQVQSYITSGTNLIVVNDSNVTMTFDNSRPLRNCTSFTIAIQRQLRT